MSRGLTGKGFSTTMRKAYLDIWNTFSLEEKQKCKEYYENNILNKTNYPHLVDTTNTRISKLTINQIESIIRFTYDLVYKRIKID
jgi:hypothetical protein